MSSSIASRIRNQARQLSFSFVALLLILSCTNEEPSVKPPAEQYPSSEATNATTVFLTGSVVTTKIKSGRIVSFTEQDSSWAFELLVDFYDSAGVHTSTLRSDSALVRERRRLLDVFGSVKVTTDEGTTLDSEHLAWSDSSRTISTDSLVVITQGEDIMSGYGFRSDPELTRIVFRRQVSGILSDPEALEEQDRKPEPKDTLEIVGDTLSSDSLESALDSLPPQSESNSEESPDE